MKSAEERIKELIESANERMEHTIRVGADGAQMDAGGIAAYKKALEILKEAKEKLEFICANSECCFDSDIDKVLGKFEEKKGVRL